MIDSYDSKLDQISAWPQSILFDKSGKPVGFLMNVITGFIPIHELFNPSSRKEIFQMLIGLFSSCDKELGYCSKYNTRTWLYNWRY